MAQNIYLLNYNDYFNRRLLKEKSLEDYYKYIVRYEQNIMTVEGIIRNINFIPNDGVDTTLIINWKGPNPNYVVLFDNNDTIISRWFVLDSTRTSSGQYNLTLRRDVIADFTKDVLGALSYIEKAELDINDSFIFNSENLTFNQIKIDEKLLQDDASPDGIAWLTAYVARNEQFGKIKIEDSLLVDYYGLENLPFQGDTSKIFSHIDKFDNKMSMSFKFYSDLEAGETSAPFYVWKGDIEQGDYNQKQNFSKVKLDDIASVRPELDFGRKYYPSEVAGLGGYEGFLKLFTAEDQFCMLCAVYKDNININNYMDVNITNKSLAELQEMEKTNGKVVKIGINDYKRIKVTKTRKQSKQYVSFGSPLYSNLLKELQNGIKIVPPSAEVASKAFQLTVEYVEYKYSFTDLNASEYSGEVDLSTRGKVLDQVFDIITLPINTKSDKTTIYYKEEGGSLTNFTQDNLLAFNAITTIAASKSNSVYDIQLLPYCPVRTCLEKDSTGNKIVLDKNKIDFSIITAVGTSERRGVIISAKTSQASFTILYNYEKATTAIDKKVRSETEFFRLAAPGYDSNFEFNAEKNAGLQYFDVDVTFKPFTPFIHIAPHFGGLYGKDYNDMRGLTCSGDFSLGRIEDKFATYELENKNYQRMFDREIQYMESSNDVKIGRGIANGVVGALGGGMMGALTGPQLFGPGGAAMGAAVGVASSLLGSAVNTTATDIQHQIDKDYKKDRFMMQLQNIQALPYNLTKVSAFCQNNKIFPVLEFYRATRLEQDAFREKIKYDGMTVGRLGNLSAYVKDHETFIRASVVRFLDLHDDTHIALAINDEMKRGMYISKGEIL